jgi:type II secretory pathway component PulJ
MKLFQKHHTGTAFTLVEMMVSAALFSLVILGFVGVYMSSLEFGLSARFKTIRPRNPRSFD